tara:strand:+ start:133 stop:528 length:396 start_codon:yes stop_codon:yes gene_type:complete
MFDLNSLTVVELKKLLKDQELPVSGNKSELISRLEENENLSTIRAEEIEKLATKCPSCNSILRYPHEYYGKLRCSKCSRTFKPSSPTTSGSQIKPLGVILFGTLALVLIAVLLFVYFIVIPLSCMWSSGGC